MNDEEFDMDIKRRYWIFAGVYWSIVFSIGILVCILIGLLIVKLLS